MTAHGMPDVDVVVVVHGTVQGVGCRWWTRRRLAALTLEGAAENRDDGTVRITARGPRDRVEELLRDLRGGTTPGHVTRVEVLSSEPGPDTTADGPLGAGVRRSGAEHDVVVVGGGPAGLSAALVLGRSRRSVLVVDDGLPRNRFARHVHGYLGHDGTSPAELAALGREECARYGVVFRSARVTRLVPSPGAGVVEVVTGDGVRTTARRVLVATGLRDELPDVPGLADRWGRDVLHCPYCHGWEYRDASLAVVASSVAEVDRALTVRQWSSQVTLVLDGPTAGELDGVTRARLAATGVLVLDGPLTRVLVERDRLTGVQLAGDRVVPCDAVLVQPRLVARDELLRDLGAETAGGSSGRVVVSDETGATGVPGVWATGNVAEPQAQVVTAAADGHRAAVAIDHDLVLEDVDRAVHATAVDAGG